MREEGFDVVVFEASDRLGGLWAGGSQRLYPSLHSNTSRAWMHFSDFEFAPPKGSSPDFPHHSAITAHVAAYMERFGLARLAELNSPVTEISRDGDGFIVLVKGRPRRFDRVCLCNGRLHEPSVPDIPMDSNLPSCLGPLALQRRGTLAFHSSDLSAHPPDTFAGRHVLVVGFGEGSGADVSELAARTAASVTIVTPRPIFLMPRFREGERSDKDVTFFDALRPESIALAAMRKSLLKFPVDSREEFTPGLHHATRVWHLHELLRAGRVSIHNAHLQECRGGYALLSDGATLPADVVVWCTGYRCGTVNMLEPRLRADVLRDAPLYEGMWVPDVPGLAFIGHDVNVWFYLEMQARWAARVWAGRCSPLPPREAMRTWCSDMRAQVAALPRQLREKSPFMTLGDGLAKFRRLAVAAGVWPSTAQMTLNLFSKFEPRLAHKGDPA